jgi:spermidine/putrescine transport system permease protein
MRKALVMKRPRIQWGTRTLQLYVLIYILYILLPLAVLVLYAFNTSKYLAWPIQGLSLTWFEQALHDRQLLGALKNSVVIALATTGFSVVIATLFAYGLVRFKFRGKSVLETINVLAIITYGVVSAVTVKMWFRSLGIPGGIWPTIIAHTTFIMPFAVLPIRDRLLNFDLELEEAAMDLGATRLRTFFDITLPLIIPALLAGGLFCFTISLGEFLLSVFLIGNQMTLPVYLYGLMRFTFSPEVFAAATFIVAFPIITVIVAAIFFRNEVQSLY